MSKQQEKGKLKMKIKEIENKIKEIGEYMIINRKKISRVISDKSTEKALADMEETLKGMVEHE